MAISFLDYLSQGGSSYQTGNPSATRNPAMKCQFYWRAHLNR
jgi:hypothetical protein